MDFKARYKRFKAWQREPFHYESKGAAVRCANCGTEFTGNYCPVCGQKASVERLNWRSAVKGISLLWGMDSRSMLYTLLQLFLRPGYLISDYLDGKRKRYYPPVKLLIIVGLAILILEYLYHLYNPADPASDNTSTYFVDLMIEWLGNHPAWGGLALCSLAIIPTWVIFRHSPRHSKHTLPEGFFIQLFIAPIIIIITVSTVISNYLMYLMVLYYIAVYRQLFGYSWWGTTWRTLICLTDMAVIGSVFYIVEIVIRYFIYRPKINLTNALLITTLPLLVTIAGYYISKHTAKGRKATPKQQDKR